MARTSGAARPLSDHQEIRAWAEERGAKPACVLRTGGKGDIGVIRLDFPGYSGEGSLEPISWDEWFEKFDDSNLALLVQDQTAGGEQSNFNKLVRRETAGVGSEWSSGRSSSSRSAGRQASTSTYSGTEADEEEDDEFLEMAEVEHEEDEAELEEDEAKLEEDTDDDLEERELEQVGTAERERAERTRRGRKGQSRSSGRKPTSSGQKKTFNQSRTAGGTSTQSRSARGSKVSAARKTAAKKAPGRSQTRSGRSPRRRAA